MKKYYEKENLENVVKESYSFSEVLRKIGLKPLGSNFYTVKKYILIYNIDISHFKGSVWNKGMSNTDYSAIYKLDEILKKNTNFKSDSLKKRLIAEGLKEWKCEKCGNEGIWNGEKLTLELHHKNGNHFDNRLENLQILCPNCHSQTDNYRSKRKKKEKVHLVEKTQREKHICRCKYCGEEFKADRKNRKFCCVEHYKAFVAESYNSPNLFLTKEKLSEEMKNVSSLTELAKKFKTSRVTIKKYLEGYGLYEEFKKFHSLDSLHGKVVIQYDLNMQKIKEWGSVADAEESTKITTIDKCARFERRTAGGFIWRYK